MKASFERASRQSQPLGKLGNGERGVGFAPDDSQGVIYHAIPHRNDILRALQNELMRFLLCRGQHGGQNFQNIGGSQMRKARRRPPQAIEEGLEGAHDQLLDSGLKNGLLGRKEAIENESIDLFTTESDPHLFPADGCRGAVAVPLAGEQHDQAAGLQGAGADGRRLERARPVHDVNDLVFRQGAAPLPGELIQLGMAGRRILASSRDVRPSRSGDVEPPLNVTRANG